MTSIIIVEDDKLTAEVLSKFLEIKNFDVAGRGINGKEGVELYKKFRPDIVLMDIMMPDFSGFYGVSEIRKINPYAKIIIITTDTRENTIEQLMGLSVSAICLKPDDFEKLVPTIEQIMKEQKVTQKLLQNKAYEVQDNSSS